MVITEGRLVPREEKSLGFLSGGEIAEVLVNKGDLVSQGQVLARLANTEQVTAAIQAADLEVASAQQAYDELVRLAELSRTQAWKTMLDAQSAVIAASRAWEAVDTDETQQEIEDAEITAADRKKELDDAQENFDKYKDLPEDNETRKKAEDELDQAQADYDEAVRQHDELVNARDQAEADLAFAQAALAEAERNYADLESGPDPDQIELAQKRLDHANAQKTAAEAAMKDLELRAPFDGTIVDVHILPGQIVPPGMPAFLLADFSKWYVDTTDLTELEVVKIETGQMARMIPDSLKDLELEGEVIEISQVPNLQSGDVIYIVRLLVDEPSEGFDPRLRWGMTVEVSFPEE
jgi:multidrug efflux pump subunit AcrA (membrane-fusion protein)